MVNYLGRGERAGAGVAAKEEIGLGAMVPQDADPYKMGCPHISSERRDFFVWVDPQNFLVKHNAGLVGSFTGGPIGDAPPGPAGLMFIANPQPPAISISPFHSSVVNWYRVEYNLENARAFEYKKLPSRFHALFLLESREEAERYKAAHPDHVGSRILKIVQTVGAHRYSVHDASWIDFLRLSHGMDDQAIADCSRAYWMGEQTEDMQMMSMGKSWRSTSVKEVLFYGRVDFLNRQMTPD